MSIMNALAAFVPEVLLKLSRLKRTFRAVDHAPVRVTTREDGAGTRTVARPAEALVRALAPEAPRAAAVASRSAVAGSWLLRSGLAFAFTYAAIAMLVDHAIFASYAPGLLQRPGVAGLARPAFAGYELLLAGALLLGRRVFLAAVLAAVTLAAIVVLNLDAFEVLFRNVTIACAAAALAVESRPR